MAITASAEQQRALLEVQSLDTTLMQLRHRRTQVPEVAKAHELEVELGTIDYRIVAIKTEISDVAQELIKAEADVQQVVAREERDRGRLDSGEMAAKEMEKMQHELEALARRRAELEEIELEVMQRSEDAQSVLVELDAQRVTVAAQLDDVVGVRDEALRIVDAEIGLISDKRAEAVGGVGAELLALYTKIADDNGGFGAAALKDGSCQGCHIQINSTDLGKLLALPAEAVTRCDDCRRILVRA